jgi:hypothetical protein
MPDPLTLAVQKRVGNPQLPRLSDSEIAYAEGRLGFLLPPLLREVYQHIGYGKFGPGFGIMPLNDIDEERRDWSSVTLYLELRGPDSRGQPSDWPKYYLPIQDHGCNMLSCIDCNTSGNPVLSYEPVPDHPIEFSFAPTRDTFALWLQDWLAGASLFLSPYEHDPEKDRVVTNPFTGEPIIQKGRRLRRR